MSDQKSLKENAKKKLAEFKEKRKTVKLTVKESYWQEVIDIIETYDKVCDKVINKREEKEEKRSEIRKMKINRYIEKVNPGTIQNAEKQLTKIKDEEKGMIEALEIIEEQIRENKNPKIKRFLRSLIR